MRLRFWLLLLMGLPGLCTALTENDFAYMADVDIEGGKPFYELEIPAIVYEDISRPDLGDLRVLNAGGQVVPHGLRMAAPEMTRRTETRDVPFFPLYQQAGKHIDDLHINIQRNSDGEVIDIRSSPEHKEADRLVGYLLDMRQWKQAIDQIKLSWKLSDEVTFIHKLSISTSRDLTRWHLIASGKPLVNLSFQGHQLKEDSIRLSTGSTNYLRLLFEDHKPGLEITGVQVLNTRSSQQQIRNWQQVGVEAGSAPGEYAFSQPMKSRVHELRVQLPENNTVVRVQALSRASKEQNWQYRGSALLYRLDANGVRVEKKAVHVTASRDPYWIIRVDQQGGGLGSGLPAVELSWQPQNLVFVARGQPPYRVVWGSARVKPVSTSASQILVAGGTAELAGSAGNSTLLGQARWVPGSVRAVNQQVLEPEREQINWRQWILWSVLILAALVLIVMAVRLMKKMTD